MRELDANDVPPHRHKFEITQICNEVESNHINW